MYFLFSGEGVTDCGEGKAKNAISEGKLFYPGPMVLLVDQLVKEQHGDSFVEDGRCGILPKSGLIKKAKKLKSRKKTGLPGKKRPKETQYFFRSARAFAQVATAKSKQCGDDVVAVLFRDCDGSHSAGRGLWKDKWESMRKGFSDESFEKGVPMLPKPISEAWLICALKRKGPYQNCKALEKRSPSPTAQKPLKDELRRLMGGDSSREAFCALFDDYQVDATKIDMPSFNKFKGRLTEMLHQERDSDA